MPRETDSEGCLSLKRCPLSPAQPHCMNSNPRPAQGFWQRESLCSGGAEAAVGDIKPTSGSTSALLRTLVKLSVWCCLFETQLFVQVTSTASFSSLGEILKNNVSKHCLPSCCGIKHLFLPTQSSGYAQSKWRHMGKQKIIDNFASKSKTWMSPN